LALAPCGGLEALARPWQAEIFLRIPTKAPPLLPHDNPSAGGPQRHWGEKAQQTTVHLRGFETEMIVSRGPGFSLRGLNSASTGVVGQPECELAHAQLLV
jgi:hypothetical protein